MKLRTWIFFLILNIALLYLNTWFDHMSMYWAYRWWYNITQVFAIIANIATALCVVIPAMAWFENEFGSGL